jgi:hypothetical protein
VLLLTLAGNCAGSKGKVKRGKVYPRTGHEGPEREKRSISTLSLTSALDDCGWSTPRTGRFTPGKEPVPIVQEAGWAPGPVWTGKENLASAGIRSPDRPARSESLYRLSYPGPPVARIVPSLKPLPSTPFLIRL